MEKIKTFPLQFTESALKEIRKAADLRGVSMKEFMHSAINMSLLNKPKKEK